jgi:hypothetical protein
LLDLLLLDLLSLGRWQHQSISIIIAKEGSRQVPFQEIRRDDVCRPWDDILVIGLLGVLASNQWSGSILIVQGILSIPLDFVTHSRCLVLRSEHQVSLGVVANECSGGRIVSRHIAHHS